MPIKVQKNGIPHTTLPGTDLEHSKVFFHGVLAIHISLQNPDHSAWGCSMV